MEEAERLTVEVEVEEERRAVRVTASIADDVRLGEVLERRDERDDQVVEEDRRDHRQGDVAKARPPACAVDPCRVVELGRDALQACDEDQHHVPDAPQAHQRQRRPDPDRALEPVRPRDTDRLKRVVEPPVVGVQHADPNHRAGHDRDLHRHVEERAEDVASSQERAVHEHRHREGEAQGKRNDEQGEANGDPQRLEQDRVARHANVVREADEVNLVGAPRVEVGEREDERSDHRQGGEEHEADDERRHEDEPGPGLARCQDTATRGKPARKRGQRAGRRPGNRCHRSPRSRTGAEAVGESGRPPRRLGGRG